MKHMEHFSMKKNKPLTCETGTQVDNAALLEIELA